METASANPFVSQNGTDMYRGVPSNGEHFEDDEDFGPETDVDMVDDVLVSPAKAKVRGKELEDDLERQRQQMPEYDPADLDGSRDTPTPPADELASNANADNLAESGGEESEEEWNYIPGEDTKSATDTQEQDDMSSQLNPNAAEFVPVSPTRLLMLDDAIISASSGLPFDKSLENIQVPSERDLSSENSHRPGDLELTNGPKHGDDYFMRDNFSTLRNKGKDLCVSSAFSGQSDTSNIPFDNMAAQVSEHIPFDKMEPVQNEDLKGNIFGTNNDFSSAFAATNMFGKSDPMTTSVMGLKDFESSSEADAFIPDTPKSTTVEAPVSPAEDVSPLNHQTDLDSPADDLLIDTQKSPELMSPGDGPQDGLISGQERTSSSGFESESGAEEGDTNVPDESSEGFVTEHRKSPPIDLSFKPIQTFSDTNPFGVLQTPTSTTPIDQFNVNTDVQETQFETPKKDTVFDKPVHDGVDFMLNTPSSFISLRSPTQEPVPFNELESPEEIPQFEQPPNANSSFMATGLPKSPDPHQALKDVISTLKSEPVDLDFVNQSLSSSVNVNNLTQDLFTDEIISEVEETSFTTETSHHADVSPLSHVDLDTTAGFLSEESKIQQDEKECEQKSKLEEVDPVENVCDISPTAVDQVLTAFDDIKDDLEISSKHKTQEEDKDDIEVETKEMNLELESHISTSDTTQEDLKNIDDEFEVISKDELALSNDREMKEIELSLPNPKTVLLEENNDLLSPSKQTNPFVVDDLPLTDEPEKTKEKEPVAVETSFTNDFASAIDSFNSAVKEDLISSDHLTLLSSPFELSSPAEPEATKTVSYQTLTPADEPKLTKTESYITGIEEEVTKLPVPEETVTEITKAEHCPVVEKVEEVAVAPVIEKVEEVTPSPVSEKVEEVIVAPVIEESVLTKTEPVQSQVVTETLIATLEETSEVPSLSAATTEVPSSAGTPPSTPAPGLDDSKDDSQKTDILVAAVAAAGAVAAGTAAVVAEKEVKKATTGSSKKPTVGVTKKPSDSMTKAPAKPAPIKAPAAKPAATKTTTTTKPATSTATKPALGAAKPAATATKPATSATASKAPAAKPAASALAAKKPTAPAKLATTATKSTTSAPKPAVSAAQKTVPKQLPVNKTSTSAMKPSSKPTTPTSKPTTPTMPKSPSAMKSDAVKSPPRPAVRSTLTTSRPASATTKSDESSEKKPLLNGDIKPLAKKTDVPVKKLVSAPKPATTARPAASNKPTPPTTKTVPSKTGAPSVPKPKAPTTTVPKTTAPAPIKRPTSTTAAKPADKTGKETVNKQISNTKPAVNGKTVPAKTTAGTKKTDTKVNGKTTAIKTGPIKKPEEMTKEEEKPTQIQEDNVTTTNGFMEHIIDTNESMKIEELAPVIIDGVN